MHEGALQGDLSSEYARRFAPRQAYRQAVWRVLVDSLFSKLIPAESRVLDLGCGWGEFINTVKAKRKYGLDLNPDSRRHVHSDVTLFQQNCSQRWPLDDASLDAIFTSNFFEHIPSKEALRTTLCEALRCLAPGGKIICMGPNIKYLPGKYWDFWDHFLPLTEQSLSEVLELVGFRVQQSYPRFLPYTMVEGIRWPMIFVRTYVAAPIFWPLFGRQFLVVAEKPATT